MSVVSESTVFQAKIAPSYVSSSGYYGYVPPCPITDYENVVVHEHKLSRVGEANGQTAAAIAAETGGLTWSLSVPTAMQQPRQQHQHNNQQELICFNGSAMETDEDDNFRRDFVRLSRCENNRCVIPEAAGLRLDGGGGRGFESVYRVAEQDETAAAARRGNRKRNNDGDPAYLFAGHPANITKKSRQDGGNGNVRYGAWRSGKRGSPALHYEPTSLSGVDVGFCRMSSGLCAATNMTVEGCRTAAGNYDSIGDSDLERPCIVASNGHDKFGETYLDYEIMLMETHGCSAYHYHRHQHLNIGVLEAEF